MAITSYTPNRIRLEAELAQPGFLGLSDPFYPGWKALVDGRESKIYEANYALRGLYLQGGKHTVEFRDEPQPWRLGLLLSLPAWAAIVASLAFFGAREVSGRLRGQNEPG